MKPFEVNVSSSRGAPMGRPSDDAEDLTGHVYLERVPFVDGDYDEGGAYWGGGRGTPPLYCAWDDEGHAVYFRAKDLPSAKKMLPAGLSYKKADEGKKSRGHDPDILEGIPRGVFADRWAQEKEEEGESFGGQDIMDIAPKTPASAKKWGREVADEIVRMNGKSLADLYELVIEHGYPHDKASFGFHLGMQTAGHGVSWADDTNLPYDTIKLPSREYYL